MANLNSSEYEEKARGLLMSGKPGEALGLFEEGLGRFPGDAELELGRGMSLLDLQRPKEAREVFVGLVERHPGLGDALQGLTDACLALGLKEEAVAAARKACGPQETDADFVHAIGHILYRHKLLEDAEWCYRRAIELDRAHGYAWVGLAASVHQRGKRDEAIALLSEAVADRLPGFWEAYSYLGCMLFDAGRGPEAEKLLRRIPLDELRDPSALRRLRTFLDTEEHPERARLLGELEARARAALEDERKAKAPPRKGPGGRKVPAGEGTGRKKVPDIVAIGDLHGHLGALTDIIAHTKLFNAAWEWEWLGGNTVVVQTGDVIDRGPDSVKVYTALERLQAKAAEGGGRVVRLLGNHELCVLQGMFAFTNVQDPEGFRKRLVGDVLAGRVQAAHEGQGILFTHAGVRSSIMAELAKMKWARPAKTLAGDLAMDINSILLIAVQTGNYSDPIFRVGISRGGCHKVGGVFWEDRSRMFPSARAGLVRQVFGHTPGEGIEFSPSGKLVDIDAGMAFGHPLAYLRVRDRKLTPVVII